MAGGGVNVFVQNTPNVTAGFQSPTIATLSRGELACAWAEAATITAVATTRGVRRIAYTTPGSGTGTVRKCLMWSAIVSSAQSIACASVPPPYGTTVNENDSPPHFSVSP